MKEKISLLNKRGKKLFKKENKLKSSLDKFKGTCNYTQFRMLMLYTMYFRCFLQYCNCLEVQADNKDTIKF